MREIIHDLRYAIRMFRKHPGFTAIIVTSLALGLGANTAIDSLVDAVVLRPLPAVERPGELAAMTQVTSLPSYKDYRDRSDAFSGLAAFSPRSLSLTVKDDSDLITGAVVSGNYFEVLGVRPLIGRTIADYDDLELDAHAVAVLSYGLWQRRFGSDQGVPGKTLRLNGREFTIIGVAPREFRGSTLSEAPELWIPISMWPRVATGFYSRLSIDERNWEWLSVIGRLKPGQTLVHAEAGLNVIVAKIADTYFKGSDVRANVRLVPASAAGLGEGGGIVRFVIVLACVAGIALLTAAANVANLMLARTAGRRQEIGVRIALGAGRWRIARQFLAESVLLSMAGGGAGWIVAVWTAGLFVSFKFPGDISFRSLAPALNWRVMAMSAALSLITGVLFGIVPALQAGKTDVISALKNVTRGHSGSHSRIRGAFLVAQVALSMVLLIGAGLFVRGLRSALRVELGFNPNNVAMATTQVGLQRYDMARAQAYYRQLAERAAQLPGVRAASWARLVPVNEDRNIESASIEGYPPQAGEKMCFHVNVAGPAYFKLMEIPLASGREFITSDAAGALPAVIVNESMARRYWPHASPLGRQVTLRNIARTVAGVAADSKYEALREPARPYIYVPLGQDRDLGSMTPIARTETNPAAIFSSSAPPTRGSSPPPHSFSWESP